MLHFKAIQSAMCPQSGHTMDTSALGNDAVCWQHYHIKSVHCDPTKRVSDQLTSHKGDQGLTNEWSGTHDGTHHLYTLTIIA